ncbi:hypothetical protein L1049_013802 [Liquidambar formosana]|uniref:PWI domain-containing protein n=1 Tax=Liquidambar formosana TaxID=63359 RepID=A0AAP0RPW4_LIQFO
MSGGFFRGTSADQDTRFSNKQAKLMKSQKFAPELDHLVDMTKVKMDVVRPWIANRVTELLGFEDEVLINFIYGLLDGKDVNGKQVQISLTGFMEKNTGKFMKELWTLLLSAQKNASGVPQQFLDAKEEETRQKKAEADRISNEIQKKKENEAKELELEKMRKRDGGLDISKATNAAALEPIAKHILRRDSSAGPKDEKEMDERNGLRGKNRVSKSPHSADCSPSSRRATPSGSIGKSFSNSRSYSDERPKLRSVSGSPQSRGRSISSERAYPRRRSITPRRRHSPRGSLSPSRRRSSHSRRRFRSRSPRRSPSPVRRRLRSPLRRRSPSPMRRRSPSPFRRRSRSPVRRRSPSPVWRRSPSPVRRRSPSPVRRRSPFPMRRRSPSPVRRRSPSPVRRRSPFPLRNRSPSPARRRRRRSPSTPRRRSPSPMRRRSPISSHRRSPTPRRRSPSPCDWSSPSPVRRRPPSPVRRKSPKRQRRSPVRSSRERIRTNEKLSPARHATLKEMVEHPVDTRKGSDSGARRPPSSLRSPQRDPRDRNNSPSRVPSWSPSPEKSPTLSESPPGTRKRNASEDSRSSSPNEGPVRQTRERMTRDGSRSPPQKPILQKPRHASPETSGDGGEINYARKDRDHKPESLQKRSMHSSIVGEQKDYPIKAHSKEDYSPERSAGRRATETQSRSDNNELRKKDQEIKRFTIVPAVQFLLFISLCKHISS